MTQETKHTPTPWRTSPNEDGGGWLDILGNVDYYVHLTDSFYPTGIKPEDAKHIVHCVNSHDALVEGAKAAIAALMNNGDGRSIAAARKLVEAIAAAGVKAGE